MNGKLRIMDSRNRLESIAKKIVEIFAILLFTLITLIGCLKVAYLDTAYELVLTITKDNFFLKLLFVLVLFLILKLAADFISKDIKKRSRILLILVCAFTFCISLFWAAVSKCFPSADQASVYYAAIHFSDSNYAEICPTGSYLACYPHQVGLVFFYDIIFRIFHTTSFHILQAANAVFNVMTIFSLYQITRLSFENKKAGIYFLLLAVLCLPLFWFTPFVYGELPSLAFMFVGVWMLLEYLKAGELKIKYVAPIGSVFFLVMAVMVRKNTLILILALLLTLAVYIIKSKDYKKLIFMVIVLALSLAIIPLIRYGYEKKAGNTLNDGVPSIAHAAMGLQESEYAPGWYNGFNLVTYTVTTDYDSEMTKEISRQNMAESLQRFRENPGYAYEFFRDKFTAEWLNTGYACFDSTAGKYYERWPVIESLFSGKLYYLVRSFMAKYQFAIYLFALIWVVYEFIRKKSNIMTYLLLATVIGGALFYIVWEGSGRYILPYFMMTLPYGAAGMSVLGGKIKGRKTKDEKKNDSQVV